MEKIAISKFKATCIAVMKRVRRTGRPIQVTLHGKPVADIVPPSSDAPRKSWIGSMKGTMTIHGDIVGPIADPNDWEAMRD